MSPVWVWKNRLKPLTASMRIVRNNLIKESTGKESVYEHCSTPFFLGII